MSAQVIGLRAVTRLRNGTPVRLSDGREGWVMGCKLCREAQSDDPSAPDVITRVSYYEVRLTRGRGTVAADPAKLQKLARTLLAESAPQGAA